jgi:hypothetical protein
MFRIFTVGVQLTLEPREFWAWYTQNFKRRSKSLIHTTILQPKRLSAQDKNA